MKFQSSWLGCDKTRLLFPIVIEENNKAFTSFTPLPQHANDRLTLIYRQKQFAWLTKKGLTSLGSLPARQQNNSIHEMYNLLNIKKCKRVHFSCKSHFCHEMRYRRAGHAQI